MDDDAPMPVWVTVRRSDGAVSVLILLETPVGLALYEPDRYVRIGQVQETKWSKTKGWSWWYDEEGYGKATGAEATRTLAIAAVLDAGGYVEAPPNATNQGLWDV